VGAGANRLGQSVDTLDGARWLAGIAVGAIGRLGLWDLLFHSRGHPIEAAIGYFLRSPFARPSRRSKMHSRLKGLSVLLNLIEAQRFGAAPVGRVANESCHPQPERLGRPLETPTIVNFVEARRNPILAPFMLLLMYPLQTALAAERWRSIHGAVIQSWLEVLGEFEALLSLAQYSYEQAADPFPEFLEGAPAFKATGLGHPLIPAAVRVCNHVAIEGETRVLLVSGSNMSGKSTLLRTIGINTVLAMAGAPVRATSLQLTPLQIGASIRINDSLHEGSSRFYAEITRLRRLFEPILCRAFFIGRITAGYELCGSTRRRAGTHSRP